PRAEEVELALRQWKDPPACLARPRGSSFAIVSGARREDCSRWITSGVDAVDGSSHWARKRLGIGCR
ncbi:MAG: hypothetical protein WBL40_14345, partial [Terrimicrobiaceae bacterium]